MSNNLYLKVAEQIAKTWSEVNPPVATTNAELMTGEYFIERMRSVGIVDFSLLDIHALSIILIGELSANQPSGGTALQLKATIEGYYRLVSNLTPWRSDLTELYSSMLEVVECIPYKVRHAPICYAITTVLAQSILLAPEGLSKYLQLSRKHTLDSGLEDLHNSLLDGVGMIDAENVTGALAMIIETDKKYRASYKAYCEYVNTLSPEAAKVTGDNVVTFPTRLQ